MSKDNRSIKAIQSTVGVLLFTIAGMAARYGFLSFATKVFPKSAVGQYSQAVSIITFLGATGVLGTQIAQDRFIPIYRTNNESGKIRSLIKTTFLFVFGVTLLISIVIYVFAGPVAELFSSESFGRVLRIFSIAIFGLAMLELTVYAYRGFERPLYQAAFRRFGVSVLTFLISGLLFFFEFGETALFVAYPTSIVLLAFLSFTLFYTQIYSNLPEKKPIDFHRIFSYSWPYTFSKAATVFLIFSDIIFIGIFMSDSDVAVYQIAIVLSSLVLLALRSFIPIYKPMCAKMVETGSEDIVRIYNLIIRISLVFGGILVLGFVVFGDGILSLFANPSYSVGHSSLIILGVTNFVVLLFGPTGPTLQATEYSDVFLKVSLARLIVNAILNVLLIPVFGLIGAAVATFSSKFLGEVLIYYRIRAIVGTRIQFKKLWRLGLTLCLTGIIAVFVDQALPYTGDIHTLTGVILTGSIYIILAYFLIFTDEDAKMVSEVLPDRVSEVIFH